MKVLPVLDLQAGAVVRGIGGQRHLYRPIQSLIAADSQPSTVAQALARQFGFRDAYVADLDAIAGAEPAWGDYAGIADSGLQLWVDAGIRDLRRAQQVCAFADREQCLEAIIVGLESVPDAAWLHAAVQRIGPERAVFSLDLRDGRPLTEVPDWRLASPFELVQLAIAAGFHRLIVLDLVPIGGQSGPATGHLCRELHAAYRDLELVSGGGVRDGRDVEFLVNCGCQRVLVASALHDGRITPQDL